LGKGVCPFPDRTVPNDPARPGNRPAAGGIVSRHECGRAAEDLAAAFLRLRGFRILARNVREGPREIDLIAEEAGWVVVVEVRYRADTNRGLAEESVGSRKRTHLLRAGRSYWLREGHRHGRLRFDLVTLQAGPDGLAVRHHRHFLLPHRSPFAR
jgi:putative endonuclease